MQSLPHASPAAAQLQKEFVEMNGHLLLFAAWLQHPEPPATQSMPFEDRSFFGVVDSLLQIRYASIKASAVKPSSLTMCSFASALRDGVDAFMDARSS
jgi:hypothetical protein